MSDDSQPMIDRRRRLLGPAYRLFYRNPVHIVRGEGVWLYDAAGRRYLDMYNNVPHVGHCHPRVVAAISEQSAILNTHTRYLHEHVLDYAERLTGKLPDELDTVMFACSGSEANELALRVAEAASGNAGVIVTTHAYHGTTKATYQVSTSEIPREDTPPHVATVPSPDAYRGQYRDDAEAGRRYADHVRHAVAALEARGIRPAAFLVDTIVSSDGVVAPPAGYLSAAAGAVREAGGLFVADEVQPGFGRTGAHFWGFEADGVVPDIVTMGKPMGNGHPLSAMAARGELVERFAERHDYFNTFGGNPVSCAAGLAVLDVIEDEGLERNALAVGRYLVEGLTALAGRHDAIGDVRGNGLFIAVDLVEDRGSRAPATSLAAEVVEGLRERGVLTGSIGPHDNILKLRPPLVVTSADADLLLNALDDTLAACGSS